MEREESEGKRWGITGWRRKTYEKNARIVNCQRVEDNEGEKLDDGGGIHQKKHIEQFQRGYSASHRKEIAQ